LEGIGPDAKYMASPVQTGRLMTRDKELDIFRGPKGKSKAALTQSLSMLEKRGMEPVGLRRAEKADDGSY